MARKLSSKEAYIAFAQEDTIPPRNSINAMPVIYNSKPSTQCSRCIQASVIQEALFNRIHMLEKQLYQAIADKDAAYRTLIIHSARTTGSMKTSDSSTICADPPCSSPESSSLSFAASSVPPHPLASQTRDKPLIDLLGPIEQAPEPSVDSSRSSLDPGVRRTYEQGPVDEVHSTSPVSKPNFGHDDAESVAYIRHFSDELEKPTLIIEEASDHATVLQPDNEIHLAKISDHKVCSSHLSPTDADTEQVLPHIADASFKSSSTQHRGPIDHTDNALLKIKGWVPLSKLHRSQWAHSNALKALLVALSSEERWKKYCQNITAKISSDLGVTCIEQGAWHTVMIYNLSADCTMRDVLDRVRGGKILDASLLDTSAITGFMTAMLTFVESTAALAFIEHVSRHGLSVSGCIVGAFLVQVPTERIKLGQIRAINSQFHSRCLRVHNFPFNITREELRSDLRPSKATSIDLIESMSANADATLELRFHSVTAAQDAFDFLTLRGVKAKYRQCRVEYGADPCAEQWAEEDSATKNTNLTSSTSANFVVKGQGTT